MTGTTDTAYLAPLTDADSEQLFDWINDRDLVVLSAPFRPVHRPDHDAWFRDIRSRNIETIPAPLISCISRSSIQFDCISFTKRERTRGSYDGR